MFVTLKLRKQLQFSDPALEKPRVDLKWGQPNNHLLMQRGLTFQGIVTF